MVKAFRNLKDNRPGSAMTSPATFSTTLEESGTATCAWHIYHVLQEFLAFVNAHKLCNSIQSFTAYTGCMLNGELDRFLHKAGEISAREWRYPAAAAFWQQLLSVIDPDRIVVLAPPTELACFTNAAMDTRGDW